MSRIKAALLASALAFAAVPAAAENGETPKYGGTLEIGTVYVTLSALSWDSADFNWKHNHDTGLFYEQLFAGDLSKSKKAGGPFNFIPDAWLPSDAIRGELAEKWVWENPATGDLNGDVPSADQRNGSFLFAISWFQRGHRQSGIHGYQP